VFYEFDDVDLTKFTQQHLINRIKYFQRVLKEYPGEMFYMGSSDAAEDAVEQENAANELLFRNIEAHIHDMKKELEKRRGEL